MWLILFELGEQDSNINVFSAALSRTFISTKSTSF